MRQLIRDSLMRSLENRSNFSFGFYNNKPISKSSPPNYLPDISATAEPAKDVSNTTATTRFS